MVVVVAAAVVREPPAESSHWKPREWTWWGAEPKHCLREERTWVCRQGLHIVVAVVVPRWLGDEGVDWIQDAGVDDEGIVAAAAAVAALEPPVAARLP